jgi:tetratricopeptide (TPR) repeat protein
MSDIDLDHDEAIAKRLLLDERPGPAARVSKERAALLVENALDTWQVDALPTPAKPSAWRMLAGAAMLLLALVGSAAAARWIFIELSAREKAEAAPVARKTPALRAQEKSVPTAIAPQTSEEEAMDTPVAKEPARKAQARDLEDWMREANRLRAAGRFAEAAAAYAQVYERHPGSVSAYVAAVAAGSIELEHLGNPSRARKLFARALRAQPVGTLDIEARQGLALALADTGDRPAEAEALAKLIAAHPNSPAAERARARLHELAARPR